MKRIAILIFIGSIVLGALRAENTQAIVTNLLDNGGFESTVPGSICPVTGNATRVSREFANINPYDGAKFAVMNGTEGVVTLAASATNNRLGVTEGEEYVFACSAVNLRAASTLHAKPVFRLVNLDKTDEVQELASIDLNRSDRIHRWTSAQVTFRAQFSSNNVAIVVENIGQPVEYGLDHMSLRRFVPVENGAKAVRTAVSGIQGEEYYDEVCYDNLEYDDYGFHFDSTDCLPQNRTIPCTYDLSNSAGDVLHLTVQPKFTVAASVESVCYGTVRIPCSIDVFSGDSVDVTCYLDGGGTGYTFKLGGVHTDTLVTVKKLTKGNHTLMFSITNRETNCAWGKTFPFEVYALPRVELDPIESVCSGVTHLEAHYTYPTADVPTRLSYWLTNSAGTTVIAPVEGPVSSFRAFQFSIAGLPADEYTLHAVGVNAHGCESTETTQTFSVYSTPTIDIQDPSFRCMADASLPIAFTTTGSPARCEIEMYDDANVRVGYLANTAMVASPYDFAYTPTHAGIYKVKMTVTDASGSCAAADSVNLIIYKTPAVTYSAEAICSLKDTIVVDAVVTDGELPIYAEYTLGTQTFRDTLRALHSVRRHVLDPLLVAGTYDVPVQLTDAHECASATSTLHLDVYANPAFVLEAIPSVCQGADHVTARMVSVTGDPTRYSYVLTDTLTHAVVLSATDRPIATSFEIPLAGLAPGGYELTVNMANAHDCGSDEHSVRFSIFQAPTLVLDEIPNVPNTATEFTIGYHGGTPGATYTVTFPEDSRFGALSGTLDENGNIVVTKPVEIPAGTYTVQVTVTTDCGCVDDGFTQTFVVVGKQEITVTNTPDDVCASSTYFDIHYITVAGAPAWYKLSFEGGNFQQWTEWTALPTDSTVRVETRNTPAGTYRGTMMITDASKTVMDTVALEFHVFAMPNPVFSIPTAHVCNGGGYVEIPVTGTVMPLQYSASFSDPQFVPQTNCTWPVDNILKLPIPAGYRGNLVATITYTSGACEGTETFPLKIAATPAMSELTLPAYLCYGSQFLPVEYTVSDASFYRLKVTSLDGTNTVVNVSRSPIAASPLNVTMPDNLAHGTYVVTMDVMDSTQTCIETRTKNFLVKQGLDVDFTASPLCADDNTVRIQAQLVSGNLPVHYSCDLGTNHFEGDLNASYTTGTHTLTAPIAAGNYNVQVTLTDEAGCSATETMAVKVNEQPTFSLTQPGNICYGTDRVEITCNNMTGNPATYSYVLYRSDMTEVETVENVALPDPNSFVISLRTDALAPDSYTVVMRLTSAAGCQSATRQATFIVNPMPAIVIAPMANVASTGTEVRMEYSGVSVGDSYRITCADSHFQTVNGTFSATAGTIIIPMTPGAAAGNYVLAVELTTPEGCSKTFGESDNATFTVVPEQGIVIDGNPYNVCDSETELVIPIHAVAGNPRYYRLTFDNPAFAQTTDWAPLPADNTLRVAMNHVPAGTYHAQVSVTDESRTAVSTFSATFTVTANPDPVFTVPDYYTCNRQGEVEIRVSGSVMPATMGVTFAEPGFSPIPDTTPFPADSILRLPIPNGFYGTFSATVHYASGPCEGTAPLNDVRVAASPVLTNFAVPSVVCYHAENLSIRSYQAPNATHMEVRVYRKNDMSHEVAHLSRSVIAARPVVPLPDSLSTGYYTAVMEVWDATGTCSASASADFRILSEISANFMSDTICQSENAFRLVGDGITGTPVTYRLEVDGETFTGTIASTTANLTCHLSHKLPYGEMNLPVYLTNTSGCESVENFLLVVNRTPEFSLAMGQQQEGVCYGESTVSAHYSNLRGNPTSYTCYVIKDGMTVQPARTEAITAAEGDIVIPTASLAAGNYKIVVTMTSEFACVSARDTVSFEIYPEPVVLPGMMANVSVNANSIRVPYSGATIGDTYVVSLSAPFSGQTGGTFTATADTIIVPVTIDPSAAPGMYSVTMTVTTPNGCTKTIDRAFTLVGRQEINVAISGASNILCSTDATLVIPFSVTEGTPARYTLTFDGGNFSEVVTPTRIPADGRFLVAVNGTPAGQYTATLTVWDATMTSSSVYHPVYTVTQMPNLDFSMAPTAAVCCTEGYIRVPVSYDFAPTSYSVEFSDPLFAPIPQTPWTNDTLRFRIPAGFSGPVTATVNCYTGRCAEPVTLGFTVAAKPQFTMLAVSDTLCYGPTEFEMAYAAENAATYSISMIDWKDSVVFSRIDQTLIPSPIRFALPTLPTPQTGAGRYKALISLTDATGQCVADTVVKFTVLPKVKAVFTPQTSCASDDALRFATTVESGLAPIAVQLDIEGQTLYDTLTTVSSIRTYALNAPLSAGQHAYTIRLTDAFGCTTTTLTGMLTSAPQPSFRIASLADACESDNAIDVVLDQIEAAPNQYSYRIQLGDAVIKHRENQPWPTSNTYQVRDLGDLAPGTYTFVMTARNASPCTSFEVTDSFTVYRKPAITLATIDPVCSAAPDMTVAYSDTANANYYRYEITDWYHNTVVATSPLRPMASSPIHIDIPDTITLTPNLPGRPYRFKMTVYNDANEVCGLPVEARFNSIEAARAQFSAASYVSIGDTKIVINYWDAASAGRYDLSVGTTMGEIAHMEDTLLTAGQIVVPFPDSTPLDIYTVDLHFTNTACAGDTTFTVELVDTVSMNLDCDADGYAFCQGESMLHLPLTLSPNAANYSISFGAGSFGSADKAPLAGQYVEVAHNDLDEWGVFPCTLTVYDATLAASASATFNVTIVEAPVVVLTPFNAPLCSDGGSTDISAVPVKDAPAGYRISFSDPIFADVDSTAWPADGQLEIVIPQSAPAGTYTALIEYWDERTACALSESFSFDVTRQPRLELTAPANVCDSAETINLAYSFVDGTPGFYEVDIYHNGAKVGTSGQHAVPATPYVTVPFDFAHEEGAYELVMSVCDPTMTCFGDSSVSILLVKHPEISIRPEYLPACRTDLTVSRGIDKIAGAPHSYTVTFDGRTQAEREFGDPSMIDLDLSSELAPGSYHALVTVYDVNGSCESSTDFHFNIGSDSLVYSKWTDYMFCFINNDSVKTFQWYRDGLEVENATGQYYTDSIFDQGLYHVRVTTNRGDTLFSCPQEFYSTPRSAEINPGARYAEVMPNPVRRGMPVSVRTEGIEAYTATLYTVTGVRVDEADGNSDDTYLPLSTDLPTGVYVVAVRDHADGQVFRATLIIR